MNTAPCAVAPALSCSETLRTSSRVALGLRRPLSLINAMAAASRFRVSGTLPAFRALAGIQTSARGRSFTANVGQRVSVWRGGSVATRRIFEAAVAAAEMARGHEDYA